jgi:uncharacterized membrane-anchored protein YhcB (DUF1043 family)
MLIFDIILSNLNRVVVVVVVVVGVVVVVMKHKNSPWQVETHVEFSKQQIDVDCQA